MWDYISRNAFVDEFVKISAFSDSVVRRVAGSLPSGRVEEMLLKSQRRLGNLARLGKASPNRERFNTMLQQSDWLRGLKPAGTSKQGMSRGFVRSQLTPSYGVV